VRGLGCGARDIAVRALSPAATRGTVAFGAGVFPCALGRRGIGARKREGDGMTPRGTWPMRQVLYRADRVPRPRTTLPVLRLAQGRGWCDAPGDRNYNRCVPLPYAGRSEPLWREDGLYDLVVVLGYNDTPRVRGRGSAIFLHVAARGMAPTAGCIALEKRHLRRLIEGAGPRTRIVVLEGPRPRRRNAAARQ
jgi:L,D-peptidoglycan transpeptidase YkuD (ErfK/YbiS/YcfS/YnhG family)